jgi:hypothetical protein
LLETFQRINTVSTAVLHSSVNHGLLLADGDVLAFGIVLLAISNKVTVNVFIVSPPVVSHSLIPVGPSTGQ